MPRKNVTLDRATEHDQQLVRLIEEALAARRNILNNFPDPSLVSDELAELDTLIQDLSYRIGGLNHREISMALHLSRG